MVLTPDEDAYKLDGCWIYLNHNLIHRDRSVYGDTFDEFEPERWLQSSGASADAPPVNAWWPLRARTEELHWTGAIEIRVIVAMLAQRYDFTKVGAGELPNDEHGRPTLNDEGQFRVKSEMYNVSGGSIDL